MSNQTYQKLKSLHLNGMADAYQEIALDKRMGAIPKEEAITLMVDREEALRHNSKRLRLVKQTAFEKPLAHIGEIDYSQGRMLDQSVVMRLSSCNFIADSRNIIVMGPQGAGKVTLPAPSALTRAKNSTLPNIEAASNLDSQIEKKIYEYIKTDWADKTLIIVTHRVTSLDLTDKIYEVRDKGIFETSKEAIELAGWNRESSEK